MNNKETVSGVTVKVKTSFALLIDTANVYLCFDGEDAECFTDNLPANPGGYEVTVSFSLADTS